ncbi:hypothetical protein [Amedibacillus sp. YH-ame10]
MRKNVIKKLCLFVFAIAMVLSNIPLKKGYASGGEVWVNGVNIVTAVNQTVQCGEGTATYNATTNTLTLNNAKITEVNDIKHAIENRINSDFTIVLNGQNNIEIERYTGVFSVANANVTFTGEGSLNIVAAQSILNKKDIIFDGVTITASTQADGSIISDGNVMVKNGSDITCSGTYFGINALGNLTISDSEVEAKATGTEMNAFRITGPITIEKESTVTAESDFVAVYSTQDITIKDSYIDASSKSDYSIWTKAALSIKGSAEVIAKGAEGVGSIGARGTFVIEPTLNERVEVYKGSNENDIVAVEGSPFATSTDLKALGAGSSTYYHSKKHEHTAVDTWSKNETSHWHECTMDDGAKVNLGDHTWDEGIVTTPATITQEGVMKHTCSVCGQIKTEVIPKLPSKDILENTSTGTKAEYVDGKEFDSSLILSVVSKPQNEIDNIKKNVLEVAPDTSVVGLFDIKLLKDGIAIQPDGSMKISILLNDEMKSMKELKIIYVDNNGNVSIIPSEVKDGYIEFVTDHFSYYGVIGKVSTIAPVVKEPTKPSIDTGDNTAFQQYLMVAVISAGVVYMARQRRLAFADIESLDCFKGFRKKARFTKFLFSQAVKEIKNRIYFK